MMYVRDAQGDYRPAKANEIFAEAKEKIKRRMKKGKALTSADDTQEFLSMSLAGEANEVFAVLWLDNRHKVLAFEELFKGSIASTSVHPRVIVQRAMHHNAAAVILAHNHPSGHCLPSQADRTITARLTDALALVDVRVLDHILVAGVGTYSFAEHGDI